MDEGGEEDEEDEEEEANNENGVEDVADHFEQVLWEYGGDDDDEELASAPAQVPTKSRYSPRRTRAGTAIDH